MPRKLQDMETQWKAVEKRNGAFDGKLYYAVTSTGVYCRPSCPSRRPKRENVKFFDTWNAAEKAGFRACQRCHPKDEVPQSTAAITRVCRFIEDHAEAAPSLETLSRVARLSRFHLLRAFKKATGMTPRAYGNLCRMRALKKNLRSGESVTNAMYDAGFGSSSRLYEKSNRELGMTPSAYKNGGLDTKIRYTVVSSPLGRMLVAATEKGLCTVQFGESAAALEQELRREFPFAEIENDPIPLMDWLEKLNRHLAGEAISLQLPLDIQATVFQRKVWEILQSIPYGETRSYSEVAELAGKPAAVRAVASACASNPVAVAIPCHRVLRSDGSLGGYRWGLSRKVQLLETERAAQTKT